MKNPVPPKGPYASLVARIAERVLRDTNHVLSSDYSAHVNRGVSHYYKETFGSRAFDAFNVLLMFLFILTITSPSATCP